tara:strand:- start:105 stop:326 length:222 start_codon:yes stop_codon:yes gene_type:complete
MLGGNPMAAMAAADVVSQMNPIIIIIILCVVLCILFTPCFFICFILCCCYWTCCSPFDSEDFTVGSQKDKDIN